MALPLMAGVQVPWIGYGMPYLFHSLRDSVSGDVALHSNRRIRWPLERARCQKMFVPGFGEKSPEGQAADTLNNFFTYVALKIVLAQLEDYNTEGYKELMEFVNRTPLKNGDHFCAALMRESTHHKGLALRILEVRAAYANRDFEWEKVKEVSLKQLNKSNTKLMREYIVETSNLE